MGGMIGKQWQGRCVGIMQPGEDNTVSKVNREKQKKVHQGQLYTKSMGRWANAPAKELLCPIVHWCKSRRQPCCFCDPGDCWHVHGMGDTIWNAVAPFLP